MCTPLKWYAQSGQDRFLYGHFFASPIFCNNGTFVEFGARNGIEHSNTYAFERFMGWKGLLLEPDARESEKLQKESSSVHHDTRRSMSEKYKACSHVDESLRRMVW